MKIITHSPEESQRVAKKLLKKLKKRIILCQGNLGSGKTIFIQGLAQGLGIKEPVKSPSFVLMKIYKTKNKKFPLFCHADLYRIKSWRGIGLEEFLNNPKVLVAIEWPEKIKRYLDDFLLIKFKIHGKTSRELELV